MNQFNLVQVDLDEIEDFLLEVFKFYDNHDVFETSKHFDLKQHYHADVESRLFLEGEATFTINDEQIHCKPGTYIEIDSNVVHSFDYSSDKPLKVMRFFSENEDWQATFV